MPEYEVHQLVLETILMGEGAFDFWLTVTFGALVAGYYTFPGLSANHRRIAMYLYCSVAILLLIRWFDASYVVYIYSREITGKGGLPPPGTYVTGLAWILQTLVMVAGSLATLSFLRAKGREGEK